MTDKTKSAEEEDTLALFSDLNAVDIREVTRRYIAKRAEFLALSKRVNRICRGSGGKLSTGIQMYYASVLFTRISVTCQSIEKLLPRPKPGEVWDFSSLASIVRNLVEATITYHWLCGSQILDEVRTGRYILLCLHDYGSRRKIFPEHSKNSDHVFEDLKRRFEKNSYLSTYDENKKKIALKGDRTPYIQDDVLKEMGADPEHFRKFYRFLSQHTHTGPISYFRMSDNDLGLGVETRIEKNYAMIAIECAITHLNFVIEEHLKTFPRADTNAPFLSLKQIERNVEIEQGRKISKRDK